MKVSGHKIKQMDKEYFIIMMEHIIKGNGNRIYNMEEAKSLGQMEHGMKDNLIKEENKAKENTSFLMDLIMKEILKIIKFKVKVYMYGLMVVNIKEVGYKDK